jgi:hypothetical protein
MKGARFGALVLLTIFLQSNAYAIKQCPEHVAELYVGDDTPNVWATFRDGGVAVISGLINERAFNAFYDMLKTGLLTGNSVTMRYHDSNATCDEERRDVRGIFLHQS